MNFSSTTKRQENLDLILAYFNNELDADELAEFKKRLKQNANFRKLVEKQRKKMENNYKQPGNKEELENLNHPKKTFLERLQLSNGKIALIVSILILLGVSTWAIFGRASTDRIFSAYFTADPGLPTNLGNYANSDFYLGMVNYKRAEYAEAISIWEPLYAANPTNDTLTYYLGVASLANGKYRHARRYLQTANNDSTTVFKEEIKYYLALSFLKKDDLKTAKSLLKDSESKQNTLLLKELQDL